MFGKSDRSIRSAGVTVALVLLIVVIALAGAGYLWLRSPRTPQVAPPPAGESPIAPGPAGTAGGALAITLYLPAEAGLEAVQTTIPRQHEAQLEARAAVAAVLAADRSAASLPRELLLRGFYLDPGGNAYVDVATQGRQEARASAREELLAIYAVVNTLTMNFPEVRQVRFLVDGKEAQTLAGHVDLTRAYAARADLVRP